MNTQHFATSVNQIALPPDEGLPQPGKGLPLDPDLLIVDMEFANLLDPLTDEEFGQLETNLLADGVCHDALVIWRQENILLGGHHRFAICTKDNIPYRVVPIDLPDREAAKRWILQDQLGKRNLTPDRVTYYRGELYNSTKQSHGGDRTSPSATDQTEQMTTTAEKLGQQFGVSPATIRRDGQYAEGVDKIAAVCGSEVKHDILGGNSGLTRQDVIELSKEPDPEAVKQAVAERTGEAAEKKNKQATSSAGESPAKIPASAEQESVAENKTITVPTEPNRLAQAILNRLGPEEAKKVHVALGRLLRKKPVLRGAQ